MKKILAKIRNQTSKIIDFIDYIRAYKIYKENSEIEKELDMKKIENSQLKKRLSTFSIALRRSEITRLKYNELVIENAKLKRDNELIELARNRVLNTAKKTRAKLNEANKKIKELEQQGETL